MGEQRQPVTGGRPRPGGRTWRNREKILRATVELVARHGVEGVKYEDIAGLAGVSQATIYRNWPVRDVLVRDALARFAEISVQVPDTGDIDRDLVDLVCAMADAIQSPIGRALVRAAMYAGAESQIREIGRQVVDQRLPELQRRFDRATASGQIPPVDAAFLNDMLSAPIHLQATRGTPFERTDAQRVTDLVLSGVRAKAEASPTSTGD